MRTEKKVPRGGDSDASRRESSAELEMTRVVSHLIF